MTDELRSLGLSTIISGMFWFTEENRQVMRCVKSTHLIEICLQTAFEFGRFRMTPVGTAWVFWRDIEVVVVTSVCQIPRDQSQIDFSPIQLFRSWDEEDYVLHFLTHSGLMAVGGGLRRTFPIGWHSVNLASHWLQIPDSEGDWLAV